MGTDRPSNQHESIQVHAKQISAEAAETGRTLADTATYVMNESFVQRISENVDLFANQHCGPKEYEQAGQLAGRFFNAGRRHSALLTLGYFVIMAGCIGGALWLTIAPLWLYLPSMAVALVFALLFSLSGRKVKP